MLPSVRVIHRLFLKPGLIGLDATTQRSDLSAKTPRSVGGSGPSEPPTHQILCVRANGRARPCAGGLDKRNQGGYTHVP